MQDWLKTFHGANPPFPAVEIAVKATLALALGLLVADRLRFSSTVIRTFQVYRGILESIEAMNLQIVG